jgi:IS30 family transposase
MKCVCPMGGDRTCPNDCLLAVWANLPADDRKARRKPIAEQLYKQGFTMEQIATQLGVTHATISNDLREFVSDLQIKTRAKTTTNPKGAGRPKGKRQTKTRTAPTAVDAQKVAAAVLDEGKTLEQAAAEFDLPSVQHVKLAVATEKGRREPKAERSDLSLTAQQKFDAAIRQEKARLAASFRQAVNDRVKEFIDATILPDWKQKIETANKLYEKRRALMDKDTFNMIRRGLHPDSRHSISDKKLGEAFDAFMALEKYLLNEKDSPTVFGDTLPRTWADWEAAKQKATAARRTRRTGNSVRPQ